MSKESKKIIEDYESGKISFIDLCKRTSHLPGIKKFVKEARKRFEGKEDHIGECNNCNKKDIEMCPDTGWCEDCQKEYAKEQSEGDKNV